MRIPRYRQLKKDAEYHVTARINRKEKIFKESRFKMLFLDVVKEAKEKYQFTMRNFCIMGNHVHMIIKPHSSESLSRIMQWILSVFAIRFNKVMGYVGHVWRGRFSSKIIDSIKQLVNTFRYITDNPVRANIVKDPVLYELNGICFLLFKIYTILEEPEGEIAKVVGEYGK